MKFIFGAIDEDGHHEMFATDNPLVVGMIGGRISSCIRDELVEMPETKESLEAAVIFGLMDGMLLRVAEENGDADSNQTDDQETNGQARSPSGIKLDG